MAAERGGHQAWVDVGKGVSIILVVYGHSQGWFVENDLLSSNVFYEAVHFFRMPFFFFLSGLFFHKALRDDLPRFLGFRVANLLYVFLLWTLIRLGSDAVFYGISVREAVAGFASAFTHPLPGLWFIYSLAAFYAVTRALSNLPPAYLAAGAAIIAGTVGGTSYLAPEHSSGVGIVDKWAMYYLYFVTGHLTHPVMFAMREMYNNKRLLLAVAVFCTIFILVNGGFVPAIGIGIIAAAFSGIWVCSFLCFRAASTIVGRPLEYIGQHSLPIYLAHIFVISIGRQALKTADMLIYPALTNALLIFAGVILPLVGYAICQRVHLQWVFKLPTPVSEKLAGLVRWSSFRTARPPERVPNIG